MFARLFLLLGLIAISAVGPGLLCVRRLRLTAAEKLSAALGLSFVLLYLAAFARFALALPTAAHWVISALCLLATLATARDFARMCGARGARRWLAGFGLLAVWGLALQALVRHYSGGEWSFDWLEHYERSLFFLEPARTDFRFLKGYSVAARPPFMNLVAGHFLAQAGTDYPVFQVTCTVLSLLVLFPLALIGRTWATGRRFCLTTLLALLMACPLLAQNATFTWTKLFSAFYVLLALAFYLAGWRKGDHTRLVLAFVFAGAGILVHYSAAPYALFLGAHYLVAVFPRRQDRWRELAAMVLPASLLLASWFGWSLLRYGAEATAASNTTAAALRHERPAETLSKIAFNVWATIIPHPFRLPLADLEQTFFQPSKAGFVRDYTFVLYQTNLVVAMGSIGGIVVLCLLARAWRRPAPGEVRLARFWMGFVLFTSIVGIAAHPTEDRFGVAHICGQPLVLLGVTFLAARLRSLTPRLRFALLLGAVLDFGFGILLQFHLEHRVFDLRIAGGRLFVVPTPNLLSSYAIGNYADRVGNRLRFLGDSASGATVGLEVFVAALFLVCLVALVSVGGGSKGGGTKPGQALMHGSRGAL